MSDKTIPTEEPETLSGVYDDLLGDMNEALRWAKGEVSLRAATLTHTDTPTVTLEPDVAAVFGNAAAVNEALRFLIEVTKGNTAGLPLTAVTE
ncbi:MAG: hypothetical protein H7145_00620 [Akkermansiaceae bacterium]|nr:hypothetical protein [Armatimonadota bacterium]